MEVAAFFTEPLFNIRQVNAGIGRPFTTLFGFLSKHQLCISEYRRFELIDVFVLVGLEHGIPRLLSGAIEKIVWKDIEALRGTVDGFVTWPDISHDSKYRNWPGILGSYFSSKRLICSEGLEEFLAISRTFLAANSTFLRRFVGAIRS